MRSICALFLLLPQVLAAATSQLPAQQTNWQQAVYYTIETELDSSTGTLTSYMTFSYVNNAPDTLKSIYFQVPANAYHDDESTAMREMQRINAGGNMRFDMRKDYKLTITSVQFLAIGGQKRFPLQAFDFSDTILNLRLPAPLLPGDSLAIGMAFKQDYSRRFEKTKPHRRHLDFINWIPRVAVYNHNAWQTEPFHFLMESSDVFSEFGRFDVTITVPGDYIIAAPGRLREGDPGWQSVACDTSISDSAFVAWRDSTRQHLQTEGKQNGPRRVRFTATRAHNFAWSASPAFVYMRKEAGIPIHFIGRTDSSRTWDRNVFARIDTALAFMEQYFGPYPFPELIVLRARYGDHGQPGVLHEADDAYFSLANGLSQMYLPGVVGTNGVNETWIAKGLGAFMGKKISEFRYGARGYPMEKAREEMNWLQRQYPLPTIDEAMRNFSLLYMQSGQNEAIAKKVNEYKDPISYFANAYLKSTVFYEMLEYVVGPPAFQAITRAIVQRHRFRHIGEADIRAISEEMHGSDLAWFFDQWLHGTPRIDYAKGRVNRYQRNDATWVTEVEIQRRGDGIMPVDVELELPDGEKVVQRWDGMAPSGTVVFETTERPRSVRVDPQNRILDNNLMNNGAPRLEFKPDLPLLNLIYIPGETYLVLWRPQLGYNDIDGLWLGLRTRGGYRTFFNNLTLEGRAGLKSGEIDGKIAYSHPLRRDNLLTRYNLMARKNEGRYELDANLHFRGADAIVTPSGRSLQLGITFSGVLDTEYGRRTVRGDAGALTFNEWQEAEVLSVYADGQWRTRWRDVHTELLARIETALPGGDVQFSKLSGRLQGRYSERGLHLTLRGNGGTSFGPDDPPLQDLFRAEGASPRERFRNNLVKTGSDLFAFSRRLVEGGAYLRGYAGQPLALDKYASINIEFGPSRSLLGLRWFSFYDIGRVWPAGGLASQTLADAGIGAAFGGRLSDLFGGNLPLFENFSARIYFPLWLSDPLPGEKATQFRWYFSIGKML